MHQEYAVLCEEIPHPKCALNFSNPFELLVATVLSAQTTDKRVNMVTPELFGEYPGPAALASANPEHVESIIHSIGFHHTKAKNIIGLSYALCERFDGEVPQNMDSLTSLPGVGRKTANVVLNVAFGEPTMAVDTHIFRVGNRTGLAPGKTPLAVEVQLLKRIPPAYLVDAHHWLILHGRYVCQARKPLCWQCAVAPYCGYQPKTASPH